MKKSWIMIAVALILAGVAIADQFGNIRTSALPSEEAPKRGYLAPVFELPKLDGGTFKLVRGEQDKAMILNFWASWCEPCKDEAPFLVEMQQKYGEQVTIYGVNGTEFDTMEGIEKFIAEFQISYPILLDESSMVFDQYQVQGFPTTVFIDRRGVIQEIMIGLPGKNDFEREVKRVVR
jgi:thiol-disulfide isomerase/thioredoxin